jgi:hypothetical protein
MKGEAEGEAPAAAEKHVHTARTTADSDRAPAVHGIRWAGASSAAMRVVVPDPMQDPMRAAKRGANFARLPDARIQALERIGQDVHRAETIARAGPMQGAVRTAVDSRRIGRGSETTGRRALVRGLHAGISALRLHHKWTGHAEIDHRAIGRKVAGLKHLGVSKVVPPKGQVEDARSAEIAGAAEKIVRVSIVPARKALAAGVAKVVRLVRIMVVHRDRSARRIERRGHALIVRVLKAEEPADLMKADRLAGIVQRSAMIGAASIARAEKEAVKAAEVREAKAVRSAVARSGVQGNAPQLRAEAAVSDRAKLVLPEEASRVAHGRAAVVGDLVLGRAAVHELEDHVPAVHVLAAPDREAHDRAVHGQARKARTNGGLDRRTLVAEF